MKSYDICFSLNDLLHNTLQSPDPPRLSQIRFHSFLWSRNTQQLMMLSIFILEGHALVGSLLYFLGMNSFKMAFEVKISFKDWPKCRRSLPPGTKGRGGYGNC